MNRTPGRRVLGILTAAALAGGALASMAPAASAADPQRVRIVTANVDFNADKGVIMDRFRAYSEKADVVLLQEAKYIDMKWQLRDDPDWIVRQDLGSDATQGSAVIVRRSIVDRASDVGELHLRLGTDSNECDTLPRYIAHVSITLKNGGVIRPASVHLPPQRCQTGPGSDYDEMIDSIAAMSANHPSRLIVGGDWNKPVESDPNGLSGRTDGRLVPRGLGNEIDGFYKPKALTMPWGVTDAGTASNGHRAVKMTVDVPSTY